MAKKNAKAVAKKATKKIEKPKAKKVAKVIKEKKSLVLGGDVVVQSPINPGQEFVVASEIADDEAIEAELMGKAMEHYVYSFKQDGKTVTGMTVAGVNETSRQLTKKKDSGIKIRIVPDSVKIDMNATEGDENGISVILMAENMLSGETSIGAKFEPFDKKGSKGKYKNTFALEKAVSKAERNAKRKLIPEKMAIEMIKKFVKEGNVQSLAPVNQQQIAGPVATKEVNYLGKLITMLANECGVKIEGGQVTKEDVEKMIAVYSMATGENIKTLKLSQKEAEVLLMNYVNAPVIAKKNKK